MKLIGPFQIFSAAPFVILPENFRMLLDEPLRMPRQHEVFAVGQRPAEAFKRLAPHYDHVAHGRLLEPLEILRQMPRDFAARANHTVQRHRSNGFEMFHGFRLTQRCKSFITYAANAVHLPRSLKLKWNPHLS